MPQQGHTNTLSGLEFTPLSLRSHNMHRTQFTSCWIFKCTMCFNTLWYKIHRQDSFHTWSLIYNNSFSKDFCCVNIMSAEWEEIRDDLPLFLLMPPFRVLYYNYYYYYHWIIVIDASMCQQYYSKSISFTQLYTFWQLIYNNYLFEYDHTFCM